MPIEPRSLDVAALADLVGGTLVGDGSAVPVDVTHDSRQVRPGSLFVAVRGTARNGHAHLAQSAAAGAVALCVEEASATDLGQIVVPDARRAMAALASAVHGEPSVRLQVVGVTGTNGKTTVTHFLAGILKAAGIQAGLIGTIGAVVGGTDVAIGLTTPESSDLQRLLAAMVDAGDTVALIEVSSHALRLGRVDGIEFSLAAFTNLSRDHLDFHVDMEDYFDAKASLFTNERTRSAVVWTDDRYGELLVTEIEGSGMPCTTVGTRQPDRLRSPADVVVSDVASDLRGSSFTLAVDERSIDVSVPVPGTFNVSNAAIAAACALHLGVDLVSVAAGLADLDGIPGRFESVDVGQPFAVIVDYAHTPDAVAAVIEQARVLARGDIVTVLGAGGDRDRAKRPLMGAAAASSDVLIITSDNPRSEDPAVIAEAIEAGAAAAGAKPRIELDRRAAIYEAVAAAPIDGAVLILGKGHEPGQEAGGVVVEFDDRAVARAALEASAPHWRSAS